MLKNKKSRTILIAVAVIFALSITAFAKQVTETINVIYNNVKILIDGIEYTAKDANGNVIEPFIYNGTTYLPVRGIANAFEKDVDWEPQTSTVILNTQKTVWLDELGCNKYETSGNKNSLVAWSKNETSTEGIKYERGIRFRLGYSVKYGAKQNDDGTLSSYQSAEYLTNNQYNTFKGKIVCEREGYDGAYINHNNLQKAIIEIYGDEKLLYTSPPISKGTKAVDFEIDISNCRNLKLHIYIPNVYEYNDSTSVGIVETCLEKK